jgi:acetyl esterase
MPLAPEIAAFIESRAALGRKPLSETDLAEARSQSEADGRERPPGRTVASIRDESFEGPAGPVRVRVYSPEGTGPFPMIVYIHGGGFVLCSIDTHDAVCRNLAADTPAVVVSVDYRLAPEHPWPAGSDDCVAAVRWAAGAAASLGADPDRIVVGGDSAGGNLAAVTALRLRDHGGPVLSGQLLIYPVTDHAQAGHPSYAAYDTGYGLTADDMRWFFEQYTPEVADRVHPFVSPLRAADLSGLPPAHVMTAEFDVLRDEGEAYAQRLSDAGVPVEAIRFDGLNHGCINQVGAWPSVDAAHAAMVGWLRRIVAKSRS